MIAASSNQDNKYDKKPQGGIVSKPYFTGEALFKVEAVNPTRDETIEMKSLQNIADMIKEPQYTSIQRNNGIFTKLEFVLSFNPNTLLGVTDLYPERLFVDYRLFINDDIVYNKDKTKVQVIDSHKNSAWVKFVKGKSPGECITEEINDKVAAGSDKIAYLRKMDTKTARFAKTGEVVLYDFLFNMTLLPTHNPEKGNSLENFVIGDSVETASDAFSKLVGGDFDLVREWIGNPQLCAYSDGNIAKIGGLLGVSVDNSQRPVKFYQEIFTETFACATFKEGARKRVKDDTSGMTTRIPKDAFNRLTDSERPWRAIWNGDTKFQEFNPLNYNDPKTVIDDEDVAGDSATEDLFPDLPF